MLLQFILIVNFLLPLIISQEVNCTTNNQLQPTASTEVRQGGVALQQLKESQVKRQMVNCSQLNTRPGVNYSSEATGDKPTVNKRVAERECDKIKNETVSPPGITGGVLATIGEFPHMVVLGYLNDEKYDFLCGGSLVSLSYVLTSAHCVTGRNTPSIVRGGVIDIGNGEWNSDTDRRIVKIIVHPNYTILKKYNDVALLRLDQPFTLSRTVNAICLYTDNTNPDGNLTITGWGPTSYEKPTKSKKLLKANVLAVERGKCNTAYLSYGWSIKLPEGITDQQICAADPRDLGDTCESDSGGPLMKTTIEKTPGHESKVAINRLVGVTSFGKGCGTTDPAVYTRVSSYLDWIEGIVWAN